MLRPVHKKASRTLSFRERELSEPFAVSGPAQGWLSHPCAKRDGPLVKQGKDAVTTGPDDVWIIRCAGCNRLDPSRWWGKRSRRPSVWKPGGAEMPRGRSLLRIDLLVGSSSSKRRIGALQPGPSRASTSGCRCSRGCAPDHLTSGPALRSDETTSRIA
jgi:hypothetical protein